MFATRFHIAAGFRWRHSTNLDELDKSFEPDSQATLMSEQLGKNFEDAAELHDLIDSIHYIRDVIVRLDQYQREGRYPERLQPILKARNAVHHHLLCLSAADALTKLGPTTTFLHKLCHTGLLIFSNLALFPLPPESGVANRLAKMLSGAIEMALETEGDAIWSKHTGILTWAILLAGITTNSTTEYGTFVKYLTSVPSVPSYTTWERVEDELLSKTIWWPYMCSRAGKAMWLEARPRLDQR